MKKVEWGLAGVLAIIIAIAALARIFSDSLRSDMSDGLGVPGWFLILVSIFELAIVAALLTPRVRVVGGIALGGTMFVATVMNLLGEKAGDADPRQAVPITIILALAGLATAWLAAGRPNDPGSVLRAAVDQLKALTGATSANASDPA